MTEVFSGEHYELHPKTDLVKRRPRTTAALSKDPNIQIPCYLALGASKLVKVKTN